VSDLKDWSLLPPLREVIAANNLRAEKKLGQNFLLDLNLTDKIARHAGDLSGATVFEIGPGPGGLTRSLLKAGAEKVVAVEYDPRAIAALAPLRDFADGRLEIVQADALETDLAALAPRAQKRIIVANLPYNIATPLTIGWLRQLRGTPGIYSSMTLMFQREVADRLTAPPGGKTYGRLSVMAQWLCTVKRLFDLPPGAFTPPPKVSSSIVQFTPRAASPDAPAFEEMEAVAAAAFNQRRKMLRSSLKGWKLEEAGIDPELRAEDLPPDAYVKLARLRS
jgi:16S rRNA (adenine1518-N6/adenine1519-N6)-dimethyltransferase